MGIGVARAIGDKTYTPYLSHQPYVISKVLDQNDQFLILVRIISFSFSYSFFKACDGLWDVMSNQLAVDLVTECKERYGTYAPAALILR